MQKVFGLILCVCLLFSGNCRAMQFSQAVEIGSVFVDQTGKQGILIKNASHNNGDYYTKARKNNRNTYGKGIAQFGNDEDALYVHYNYYTDFGKFYFGGKNKKNTIASPNIVTIYDIFRIDTDEGITLYPLHRFYGPESEYIIIGRRTDGRFVKYINTEEITKRYFGEKSYVIYKNVSTQGDTLIIDYYHSGARGKFYFKWDDNAQWFSVKQGSEKVVRS